MRFDLGTLDSGERSLPFGLLVCVVAQVTSPVFPKAAEKLRIAHIINC